MIDAEKLAPALWELLRAVGMSAVLPDANRKNQDLVYNDIVRVCAYHLCHTSSDSQ